MLSALLCLCVFAYANQSNSQQLTQCTAYMAEYALVWSVVYENRAGKVVLMLMSAGRAYEKHKACALLKINIRFRLFFHFPLLYSTASLFTLMLSIYLKFSV